jgi:heme/copper-type cytochrome/quinol oxidase subunit 4
MFNVALGIVAQLCLTILPMYIVLGMQLPLIVTLVLITIIVLILKKTWWNKLNDDEDDSITNQPQGQKIREHEYSI